MLHTESTQIVLWISGQMLGGGGGGFGVDGMGDGFFRVQRR